MIVTCFVSLCFPQNDTKAMGVLKVSDTDRFATDRISSPRNAVLVIFLIGQSVSAVFSEKISGSDPYPKANRHGWDLVATDRISSLRMIVEFMIFAVFHHERLSL